MNTPITMTAAVLLLLLLLTAACSPTDSVPPAYAQPPTAPAALYPEVAAGATDGQVDEYH